MYFFNDLAIKRRRVGVKGRPLMKKELFLPFKNEALMARPLKKNFFRGFLSKHTKETGELAPYCKKNGPLAAVLRADRLKDKLFYRGNINPNTRIFDNTKTYSTYLIFLCITLSLNFLIWPSKVVPFNTKNKANPPPPPPPKSPGGGGLTCPRPVPFCGYEF